MYTMISSLTFSCLKVNNSNEITLNIVKWIYNNLQPKAWTIACLFSTSTSYFSIIVGVHKGNNMSTPSKKITNQQLLDTFVGTCSKFC